MDLHVSVEALREERTIEHVFQSVCGVHSGVAIMHTEKRFCRLSERAGCRIGDICCSCGCCTAHDRNGHALGARATERHMPRSAAKSRPDQRHRRHHTQRD